MTEHKLCVMCPVSLPKDVALNIFVHWWKSSFLPPFQITLLDEEGVEYLTVLDSRENSNIHKLQYI